MWNKILWTLTLFTVNGQCNGHSCAANAYCQNGKCQCRPGYYGDPYIVCRRKFEKVLSKTSLYGIEIKVP